LKLITPSDILLLIIIIAGILLALLVDIIAVKVIGVGLAIIFTVGLFMILGQRKRETIASQNKKPNPPNYKTTVKKDTTATRQTFDDFMDKKNNDEDIEETDFSSSSISGDEGFRIIKKKKETKVNEVKDEISQEKETEVSDGKIHISPKLKDNQKIEKDNPENKEEISIEKEEQKTETDSKINAAENNKQEIKSEDDTIQQEKENIHLENLMEDPPKSDEPRLEFEYCVSRILVSIRAVSSTRSACFFLMNNAKEEIKLESYATDVPKKLLKKVRFPIGNDLISSILKNEKPEIVTEIQDESQAELIPYYSVTADIKSFIGVPVFYENQVIGVLCADSPLADAYDSVMVNFLSQLNTLITTLLGSYIEKYDLQLAFKSLEAINLFREKQASEDKDIMWALLQSSSQVMELDSIGIIVWDEENSKWYCAAEIGVTESPLIKDYFMEDSSITNTAITNQKVIQANLKNESKILLSTDEDLESMSWIAAIPVKTRNAVFGALLLCHSELPDSDEEINLANTLCDYAAAAIEKVQLLEMLSQNSLYDYDTGLMNRSAFEDSLKREFSRAKDNNENLTLCLINIDKYASFEPGLYQKRMEAMIYHVIKIVNDLKRDYDIFGKADDKLFGVILPSKDLSSAKIWAEKLRSEIATSMINFESKKFNVTVSIGLADKDSADNYEDLLSNSFSALKISLEKTNFVSIFS
jgi:diguanylate cyclase (GGDEF)-like protein